MSDTGLEQLAKLSGTSADRVEELLSLLKAPASLTHLVLVMSNLQRALKAIQEIEGLRENLEEGDEVEGQASLLNYLLLIGQLVTSVEASNAYSCPDEWLDRSGKQRGIINDHPEWAMLILTPGSECYDHGGYWQHTGVVMACSAIQRRRHQERIGSEITAACRDIRTIGQGKKALSLLEQVDTDTTLKGYYQKHLLEGEGEGDEVRESLAGIELLVRKVLSLKGKTREGGGGGGRSGRLVERQVVLPDGDDEDREGPEVSVQFSESIGDEQSQGRQRTAGLHPKETQKLRAVSFTESKASPTLGFDLRDLIRRQKSRIQHISQSNQRLFYRYASLGRVELATAAELAFQLFTGRGRFEQRDAEGVYAGLLLLLMIWLGRPVEQLLGMRVYNHQGELPKHRKEVLAFLIDEHAFVLPIPTPEWRNSLQDDAKTLLYTAGASTPALVDDVVVVASPVRIGKFISNLGLARKGRAKYRGLFPEHRREAIEGAMRAAVSKANRAHRMRLTPLRISQALFDEIVGHSSDWVDAYLLTGQRFTIADVAAHYYSVPAGYLEALYHDAAVSLRNSIYKYLSVEEKHYYAFQQPVSNSGDHGSKLNLKPMLLTRLVKHLKNDLRAAKRLAPGEESWRQVHNHYVAYMAFWILFATGYRAVNDLVFRWREIDFDTGFLVISDKDDEAMSQARVVWLLPEVLEQLRCYAYHLEVLQARLYQRNSLYEHLDAVLSEPRPNVPLMFFISDSWQVVQLSPENLRQQVPIYTLPINASRHYLRSTLRAEGVRGELVNAFLGHAQQGQEPFGGFSTLSPVEMFRELAPVLSKMRREAGWTVQQGLADV
ncbi:hypothetical protein [Vreelandella neptunia]|uniref:Uncharacterized protein n=1 Tax=Vreelandella neptunia TaxID=115551 RepID=A0ABS9SC91_9GAMM|nr:hypothetical protein [Halomonas neptunia]MCH4813737.1 hypothetical protein [Halomonas neptunia]